MVTKKEKMLKGVKKVISSYSQKLTLRQIYYRLVSKLVIENKISQYKYLSRVLVDARKAGIIPYRAIEDRTRDVNNSSNVDYKAWKDVLSEWMLKIKTKRYFLPTNLYQQRITLIVLEKQALEGIFERTLWTINNNAILITCRGYNSLTQIWDLSKLLKNEKRDVHCRFFSDYDPSGLDIQRNFIEQCKDLGIVFKSFKRVALKRRQIKKYSIPFAPTKSSDSRAKNWNGKGSVELDALDPNILEALIKDTVREDWDKDIQKSMDHLEEVLNRRFIKTCKKKIIKLAEEIKEGGGIY